MERPLDYTTRLPDEVLDIIIQEICPRYNTAACVTVLGLTPEQNWLSCSSVCRRWHRITLPHAFRYVWLNRQPGPRFDVDKVASRFLSFIRDKPSIAPLIQEITFKQTIVDINLLRSILVTLTELRYIVFFKALIRGSPHETMPITHGIQRLAYVGSVCDSYDVEDVDDDDDDDPPPDWESICKSQVPLLLRLFPTIDEFQVLSHCHHSDYVVHPVDSGDGRPPIRSLHINVDLGFSSYLNSLHRLNFLKHLTCLRLMQCSFRWIGEEINVVLAMVGGSLLELSLGIHHRISPSCDFTLQSAREVAGKLDRGISACSSLHGFRLELKMTTYHHPSTIDDQETRNTLAFGILIGIEIIALVNPTYLKHLSFCYQQIFPPQNTLANVRNIDFSNLGNVHRRFTNLRTLSLDVYGRTIYSHIQTEFIQYVRRGLEGFQGKFYYCELGSFFRCDEPSCAWSSSGKLNEYLTLDREIYEHQ